MLINVAAAKRGLLIVLKMVSKPLRDKIAKLGYWIGGASQNVGHG